LAAGAGASMMYLLDPARGRRRRRLLADKVVHAAHVAGDAAGTTGRDLANHARGAAAVAKRRLHSKDGDDEVIAERVRAELGRVVSHPGAIEVDVDEGLVTLRGDVLAREVADLLDCVERVRGVDDVANMLQYHEEPGRIPSLQGQGRPATRRFELRQENWTPAARLLIGVAGGLLMTQALRSRGRWNPASTAMSLTGVGLMTRAMTNLPFDRLVGVGAGRRAITLEESINVAAPVDEVFAWLSAWEQWPQWMTHVHAVRTSGSAEDGRQRTHWVVDGPAGTRVTWDAVVTRIVPNELIAWKTVGGSAIRHAGRIRVVPTDQGTTRVDVQMSYNPVLGAAGHAVAALFRRDPRHQLNDDLLRLKTAIETGQPAHDAAASRTETSSEEAAQLE
ncbi:MAG TPA: SRPBCC family protein, partial [Gemmatimonadaceae bacterium]